MLERRPAGEQRRTPYRLPVNPDHAVFGGLVFAIVTLLVVVVLWASQGRSQVEVPALAGLPRVQAEALLKNMGLTVRTTVDEVSDQPVGTVLRTDPAKGVALDQGAGVSLVLAIPAPAAKASGTADAPPAPQAPPAPPVAAPAPDLKPTVVVVPAPPAQPAPVVAPAPVVVPPPVVVQPPPPVVVQPPPPGPQLRQVPDVVGEDRARAARELADDGLSVGSVTEQVSDQRVGTVLWTNPKAGTAVAPATSVDLVIAKRADQVKVPDVVGKDQARAAGMLRADGLSVGSVSEEVSKDQPAGTVLRTNPKAGTAVRSGSAVDLIVAKAPPADPPNPGSGVAKRPGVDADRRGR